MNEPQMHVGVDTQAMRQDISGALEVMRSTMGIEPTPPGTAPIYRPVDALTGTVAERQAIKERDDARASRDNMVDLTIEVGRLGNYLKHAVADVENLRDMYDEMSEKYQAAQCRLDEMAAEIRELNQRDGAASDMIESLEGELVDLRTQLATARTERDTAVARAAI